MLDDITLHEMNISTRTKGALHARAGIWNLSQIALRRRIDLLRLPNFGQRALDEVRAVLKTYGLKLQEDSLSEPHEDLKTIEHSIEHLALVERLDRIERLLLKYLEVRR